MKTMTIFFIFFIFLISIVLISITSKGEIVGYLNQSGFIFYTLDVFNDSTISNTQSFIESSTTSIIGLNIPKNATILSSFLTITGLEGNGTITLLPSETEDATLQQATPDSNAGTSNILRIDAESGDDRMAIIRFNLTNLPFNITIFNATFQAQFWQNNLDIGESIILRTYHVNNTQNNSLWNETNITWNSRPLNPNLNITSESNYTVTDTTPDGAFDSITNILNFSVLNMLKHEYRLTSTNLSFTINASPVGGTIGANDHIDLTSREGGNTDNPQLIVNYTSYSQDIILKVNGTPFFNNTGIFNTTNSSVNFSSYLQSFLSDCIPNTKGICLIAINITSTTAGKIQLSFLEINYTYNISPYIEVAEFTNKTYNFTPNTLQSILKKFRFKGSFPTTDLNITGFFVNSSTTNCFIDGVSRPVGINSFKPYCNLTTPQYLNSSGGTWTNHTVFDNTSKATYSPVNLTNSSQILNNSRERIRFFNVTSYYPNGSIANDSLSDIIYNITVQINLTDTDLPNRTQGYLQGIKWHNGSEYIEINTSNRCTVTNNIYEDNYTYTLNAGLNFSGCYNDTNNNDVWDYFKVLVPKFSNQQFYAYGQEDTKFPNVTIIQPTGTFSSSSISLNLNVTDDIGLSDCYYNITNDIETVVEVPKTIFSCGNYSSNHTIATNDDYFINVFANDTSGNINITRGSFSVSISGGGGTGGGGGGGGDIQSLLTALLPQKKDCRIFLTPEHFDLTTDNAIQQLQIKNLEDTLSYSPTFKLDANYTELRGAISQIILPKQISEIVLVYKNFVSTKTTDNLIISDINCKDIKIPITLYPLGEKPPATLIIQDFLNEKVGTIKLFNKDIVVRLYHFASTYGILALIGFIFFTKVGLVSMGVFTLLITSGLTLFTKIFIDLIL